MRKIAILIMLLVSVWGTACSQGRSFYDYSVTDIYGEPFDMKNLRGQKVMVVNVASECGLTPQYEQLQEIYEKYKDEGFVIIGFPANDFMEQEPGTDAQIIKFCESNFGVTFPIMSKISVKGDGMNPLYRWLTEKDRNGVSDAEVEWNFHKFLIDEQGRWVASVPPCTLPDSPEIIEWIEKK